MRVRGVPQLGTWDADFPEEPDHLIAGGGPVGP